MRRTVTNNPSARFGHHRFLLIIGVILVAFICSFYFFNAPQLTIINSKTVRKWSNSNEKIRRPSFVNEDHGFCGPCPKDKQISTAWQLKDLVEIIQPENSFLVNIGAASAGGGRYDPSYPLLLNSSFGALLIDPNSNPALFSAYPKRENIRIRHDYIWAETIVNEIFLRNKIEQNFAVFKLDIDSYECSILETILQANFRPQIIHTEFNPIFPPPIVFMPIYNAETKLDWQPALWANSGAFYGCSLTALTKLMLKFDYVLLQVEFWDVVFIQEKLAREKSIVIPADDHVAYLDGFLSHTCFPYCRTNRKLQDEKINKILENFRNSSTFLDELKSVIDTLAPKSIKTRGTHPYRLEI